MVATSGIRAFGQPMRTPGTVGLVEPRRPLRAAGNIAVAVPARIALTRHVLFGPAAVPVAPALLDGLAVF